MAHQVMGMLQLKSITTFHVRVVAVRLHGRIDVYTYDTDENTRVCTYENMSGCTCGGIYVRCPSPTKGCVDVYTYNTYESRPRMDKSHFGRTRV